MKLYKPLVFKRTTILTVGLLSFLAGLGLARSGQSIHYVLIIIPAFVGLLSLRKKNIVALLAFILLGITLGLYRGNIFMIKISPYKELYSKQVVVRIKAQTDGVYASNGQLEFDASEVQVLEPYEAQLPGILRIQGYGAPAVYRSDIIEVSGKLYPTGGSRMAKISYAVINVVGRGDSWIEKTRLKFVASMQTALPEPQALFGLGLLLGQRNTLPDDVSRTLSMVGLTHIIAVSGYNLTIIVRGIRRTLGKRSKYQFVLISLALIGCFILFTGFSASIVRAGLVSVFSIFAWYFGRTFKPMLLISLVASITAFANPIYIWSDIGWYLSFLAFFGVMILAPLIKVKLFGKKQQKFLGQVILESFSAQLMTIPLIVYIFKEISLIALLSNAIIVPLVPLAMLLSVISGVSVMISPVLSGLFAWPATILLTYMLDVAKLLSNIPHVLIEQGVSLSGMIVLYSIIIFVMLVIRSKMPAKYVTITDRNIIE